MAWVIFWVLWGVGAFASCVLMSVQENRKYDMTLAGKAGNILLMLIFFPMWAMWPFCIGELVGIERKHWHKPEREYKKIWNKYDRYLAQVDMMEAWYRTLDGEAPPHPYPLEYPDVPDPRTEKERAKIPKVGLHEALDLIDTANKAKTEAAANLRWKNRYRNAEVNPPADEVYSETEKELDLFGVRSTDELIERIDKELEPPPPPDVPAVNATERWYDSYCHECNMSRYDELVEIRSGTGEVLHWYTRRTECNCPRRRPMHESLRHL